MNITLRFTNDPLDRRVRKITRSATSSFAYDGANIVEETDASGTAVARYSQGLNIDEPLAMLRGSATHFYNADGLGSITSLTDSAGAIASSYTYDAFGNLAAFIGTVTNPFRYTAREWDTETGLYYYRARYFGRNTGRFLSEDPIGFEGGGNFYPYVSNDATNSTDPSGLLQVCCRPGRLPIASQFGACHCFILLSDGNRYSGTGLDPFPSLNPIMNGPGDDPKLPTEGLFCNKIPGTKCDEERVRRVFSEIPRNYYMYGDHRMTSNTVAAEILRRAGISYNLPACAWGASQPLAPSPPILSPKILPFPGISLSRRTR